jgi:hypothetical protein
MFLSFRINFCLTFFTDRTPRIIFLSYDEQLESNKNDEMDNSINFKYQLIENNLYGKYQSFLLKYGIVIPFLNENYPNN